MRRHILCPGTLVIRFLKAAFCLGVCGLALGCAAPLEGHFANSDWRYYNGDTGGTHYSSLSDINTANVFKLKLAWAYDTLEADLANSTMESNPLVVDGRLFFTSPKGRLISLDAETGKELWTFDPAYGEPVLTPQWLRGVSYWTDGIERRILFSFRNYLYAVDADSGCAVPSFGSGGRVDLSAGIDRAPLSISVENHSPGAIYKNLIIMGSTGKAPGDIRAFDVRTGELRWTFHTIPRPGELGYDTWPKDAWAESMGANNWAGMTLDEDRGLLFVPLASGGQGHKDFYGADRRGDNLFADALVALDIVTGHLVWFFQTVRHDLWDRDLPAPPTLVSITRNGKRVDAVAQSTKMGFIYVLDRATGKSLFPIIQQNGIPSDVPGEVTASTQIEPQLPAPFARQHITMDLLTRRTPEAAAAVQAQFRSLRNRGVWDPPSDQGTIEFPGIDGGGQWGGTAYDPETGILYVNSNEMAWIVKVSKHSAIVSASGRALYNEHCAACHGKDGVGNPPHYPSLIGVGSRLSYADVAALITNGGGRMPAVFPRSRPDQLDSLVTFVRKGLEFDQSDIATDPMLGSANQDDYTLTSVSRFLDPDGYPAISPPWGTLNAIDLNTGRYIWKIPFGEYPELAAKGMNNTGSENYGGPIVTAGGLLFIGATSFDNKFRAFNKRTGALLWETVLPAGGNATPATYRVNGRQFVVIAAGGGRPPRATRGSKIVAFALPN
jgi:quinoprotein glucose dehydrogenase